MSRNTSRDIQVIISEGKTTPTRKRSPFQARFRRPFKSKRRGAFLPKRRLPLGTRPMVVGAPGVKRDPETDAYRQGVKDGREDARHGQASDILAAWHAHKLIHGSLRQYAKGYIKGSKMGPRQREFEWARVLRTIAKGPRVSQWGVRKNPGRDPSTSRDFADEIRTLSVQALGRLLRAALRNGDDQKCQLIEREIDRRGRMSRRR